MRYAEVSVNSPAAQRQTFSYAIPSGLSIDVGQAVWVPFGEKILQGIVLELSPYPAVAETREIIDVIEHRPLLSPAQVILARWISEYYLSPLFDAVALMLPPGFERKALTLVSAAPNLNDHDSSSLSPAQRQVMELLRKKSRLNLKELEKRVGKKKAQTITSQLVKRGLVTRSYEIEPVKISTKRVPYLLLNVATSQAREMATKLQEKRAVKQANLLNFLAEQSEPVPLTEARQRTGANKSVVDVLIGKV